MPPLKSLLRQTVHSAGGMQVFRFFNVNGVRILMYHHFSPDTTALEWQCKHIRTHYQPISMDSLADGLNADKRLPRNALVITIDDGYRDFLKYGYPVFRKFELPTLVYLVSGYVDGALWLWWNQIEFAFLHTRQQSFSLELAGATSLNLSFKTDAERLAAGKTVAEVLTRVDDSERLRLVKLIPELLEVEIPTSPPEQCAPLNWAKLRELAQNGVDFGAHTKTHPILSRIQDPAAQREEIEGSRVRLEQELGKPLRHFCYPNGSRVRL